MRATEMFDPQILASLQSANPKTDDYLTQVGYLNNNLMRMREILQADQDMPDWLDQMGYSESDLLEKPNLDYLLKFLKGRNLEVWSLWEMPGMLTVFSPEEISEMRDQTDYGTDFFIPMELDTKVWELPQLEAKVIELGQLAAKNRHHEMPEMTFLQALVIVRVIMIVDSLDSHEQAVDLLRSALSSEFLAKVGQLPPRK